MTNVTIFPNAIDATDFAMFPDADVCELLAERFGQFPDTAKIYRNSIDVSNDVTPHDEASIARLQEMTGNLFVVVWPEDPLTIGVIVAIAIAAVAIGLVFLFRPRQTGQQEGSPNNELADRQNKARPNERIPDIYGTVRSTPDLLALPYRAFVNNQEFEYCYMCIGRGHYDILDCRDDSTPIDDINGEFCAVYPPFNSPNSPVPAPQATFGIAPTTIPPVVTIQKSNSVNGQVLRAPNSGNLTTNNNIAFTFGGVILCNDSNIDLTEYFVASSLGNDQFLQIFTNDDGLNASDPAGIVHSVGLAGTYKILAVTAGSVTLSSPALVNANWNTLNTFSGAQSTYFHTFVIQSIGDKWVGPYILNVADMTQAWANIVGQDGLYYIDNKGRQGALTVTVLMAIRAVDSTLTPVGDEVYGTINLTGSALTRNIVGSTLRMELPSPGPCQVRMKLVTPMGVDTRNTYVQNIQWRDLFAVSNAALTIPPPIAIPAGQGMAWAVPATFGPPGALTIGPSIFNSMLGVSGGANATATDGFANLSNGDTLLDPEMQVFWSNFTLPANFPVGATITGIYVAFSGAFTGFDSWLTWTKTGGGGTLALQGHAGDFLSANLGTSLADLASLALAMGVQSSSGDAPTATCYNLRCAVYYTTPGLQIVLNPRVWAVGDFGNVTTALTIAANTPDALTVKERKINMLVTRKIPTWYNRTAPGVKQFSPTLYPTNNAADIICAMCLDPFIGRRLLSEIDVAEIYGIADALYLGGEHVDGAIATYFGTFLMTEFCYTFDDSKVSFEEMLADIGQTINSIAYRSGSTIGLSFEKLTANSKMLFNHRNKLPGSETRTFSFGQLNDNDGVNYDYIDPNAPNLPEIDTSTTLYFPPTETATNPKKITSIGVRNPVQALINASRMYAKLVYANGQVEFTATQEATLRLLNDRVLVADNTRPDTQDGEVIGVSGLTVTTSQKLNFQVGHLYTVFLQHYDDTVEAISVTAGAQPNQMVLSGAPALPLVNDPAMFAKTTYIMVDNADALSGKRPIAFLISGKEPQDDGTFKIACIIYDPRYYAHDQDVATGVIVPPIAGYSTQGYIGIGLQKADGSTYVPVRTAFNNPAYLNSTLNTLNNVPSSQQVTTPPQTSVGQPTVEVNGASTGAPLTDFSDTAIAAPAGTRQVHFVKTGDTDKQSVSANVIMDAGSIILVLDGSGTPITPVANIYVQMPYAGTITGFTLLADQPGTISVGIKKSTFAAFPTTTSIVASAPPALASAQKATSTTLTGWTTALAIGDVIEFVVAVTSTSITRITLQLAIQKS